MKSDVNVLNEGFVKKRCSLGCRHDKSWLVKSVVTFFMLVLISGVLESCSSEVAGGSSDDAGIYAVKNLNVAGTAQKGPFVNGTVVTVRGVDCKTMESTGENFKGLIKNDKGDFDIEGISLSSSCAIFEVTGRYLNEITGQQSTEEVILRALTDLNNRKNVNVNVLTHLEYGRVEKLVTEKKATFADAKKQAEKDVLTAFGIKDDIPPSEDLNLLESGTGNSVLLATSVLVQVSSDSGKNVNVAERLEKIGADLAKDGSWDDSETKTEIANWIASDKAKVQMESVRKNLENWGTGEISDFEKFVENFADTASHVSILDIDWNISKEAHLNPNIKYDSIVDGRDGHVYRTVKIGNQVWMAENLNYADSVQTPSLLGRSWCHENKPERCDKAGRLYTWAAIIDSVALATDKSNPRDCGFGKSCTLSTNMRGICPEGWHVPDTTEWNVLIAMGADKIWTSSVLGSKVGWSNDYGTDDYGFSAFPAGNKYRDGDFLDDNRSAYFWSLTEELNSGGQIAYKTVITVGSRVNFSNGFKDVSVSLRCLKDEESHQASSYMAPCKTETEDNCDYGSLTDSRDGQVYKTVKIGNQTWMAENLNYADSVTTPSLLERSWCYDNKSENCISMGRLYTWTAAIDSMKLATNTSNPRNCGFGLVCGVFEKVQGICPEGWHLPDTTDWNNLITSVGGWDIAGKMLKSQKDWLYFNGSDGYGFSALPGGFRYLSSTFDAVGGSGYFWVSTEKSEEDTYHAYSICLGADMIDSFSDGFKDNGYSIRCVKD